MCQFHACADFNHYTLCYSCVHHLIQHIKAFSVLLVKYDSLHLSPASACQSTSSPLIHGHSCLSENPSAAQRENDHVDHTLLCVFVCILITYSAICKSVCVYVVCACVCVCTIKASYGPHQRRLCKHSNTDSVRGGSASES